MYETIVKWAAWFNPILKPLVGIACLKYIILDW